jgi:hypothetical protein
MNISATFTDGTNTGTYWSHMDVITNTTLHRCIHYMQRHSEPHHDRFD